MSVTIKDVARDTGLSTATVSKYLNNRPVSLENRERIARSIEKLNYVPNRAARGLRSRLSHSICVYLPNFQHYQLGDICNYIVMELKNKGFSTIVRTYGGSDAGDDLTFLKQRQIDGVLLFTEDTYPSSLLLQLRANQIPYVCMLQRPDIPSDFVGCDDEAAGRQAAEYLYGRGHTRVALLGLECDSARRRIKGFLEAQQARNIAAERQYIHLHAHREPWNENLYDAVMDGTRPTAVVFLDHMSAMQTMGRFLHAGAGRPVPALLAFDDDELFTALHPALTVIDQNSMALGCRAAELLLRRIDGVLDDFPHSSLAMPILIERESVTMAGGGTRDS